MLVLFSNMELALTIQIILFFLFFLYLVIKYKRRNIDYKIIISYVVITIIEFLIVYLFSSKFNLIIKEDFSNYEQIFMFIYSIRVGTPAEKMENQVPEIVKHERFERLKELYESRVEENNQKYINTIQKVMVTGFSKNNGKTLTGRTETNKTVIFDGSEDLIGKIIDIKIISQHKWYLKGAIL